MLIGLILSSVISAGATTPNPANVLEKPRVVDREAVAIGQCEAFGNRFYNGGFSMAISERLNVEVDLVQVSYEGLLQQRRVETVMGPAGRTYEQIQTYTKRFVGPSAASACELFANTLRQNPKMHFTADRPIDSELVGSQ